MCYILSGFKTYQMCLFPLKYEIAVIKIAIILKVTISIHGSILINSIFIIKIIIVFYLFVRYDISS